MARLRSDPESIEKVAREALGLVKPGERVLKLPPSPEASDRAMELLFVLFLVALFLNVRAAFKLALDWKGMLTTLRFVRDAYARLDELPARRRSSASRARRSSCTWCPRTRSPTSPRPCRPW